MQVPLYHRVNMQVKACRHPYSHVCFCSRCGAEFSLPFQTLCFIFPPCLVVTGATDGIGKAYAEEVRPTGLWTFLDSHFPQDLFFNQSDISIICTPCILMFESSKS